MRLNAKILKNVNNVNSWVYTSQTFMQEGQANNFYIQLVDLDQSIFSSFEKSLSQTEVPMRYMSSATSIVVKASFDSLDDDSKFEVTGTQPFALDNSIWKFDLTDQQTPSSGAVKITIIEDGISRSFYIKAAISVDTLNIGSC